MFDWSVKMFQIMRARCKTPNHIHAPTTVQRKGQGLISIWTWEPLFKLTFCSDVFTLDMFVTLHDSEEEPPPVHRLNVASASGRVLL
jgi:hypothetical protein